MFNLHNLYGVNNDTLQNIIKYEDELRRFSHFTGNHIKTIYLDKKCDEFLANHMANKLNTYGSGIRNTKASNVVLLFVGGSDGTFKNLMKNTYFTKLYMEEFMKIMNFFHWIMCSLGSYDIDTTFNDNDITHNWKTLNCVDFFFFLSEDNRILLVDKYNTHCSKYEF